MVIHSLFDVNEFGEDALGCAPDCPYLDDLLAPPACAHCSEPLAGLDTVHDVTEVPGRDLRGAGMQLSTIAQVVSAGEPTAIVACSVAPRLGQVAGRVPFDRLGVPGVDCGSAVLAHTPRRVAVGLSVVRRLDGRRAAG